MKAMHLVLAAAIILPALNAAAQPQSPVPAIPRTVTQTVTSTSLPALKVEVSPTLSYLGEGTAIAMRGTAEYNRFVFGESKDGRLVRAVIVHFERILPNKSVTFDYPRTKMIQLGGEEYLHQTFPATKQEFWDAPDMVSLLKPHGLEVGDLWVMGRYVRVVDPAKKHEVLIFYLESEELLGKSFPELAKRWQPGAVAEPGWVQLEQELFKRQQAAVRIVQ